MSVELVVTCSEVRKNKVCDSRVVFYIRTPQSVVRIKVHECIFNVASLRYKIAIMDSRVYPKFMEVLHSMIDKYAPESVKSFHHNTNVVLYYNNVKATEHSDATSVDIELEKKKKQREYNTRLIRKKRKMIKEGTYAGR